LEYYNQSTVREKVNKIYFILNGERETTMDLRGIHAVIRDSRNRTLRRMYSPVPGKKHLVKTTDTKTAFIINLKTSIISLAKK
jgi:hypothetical protein